MFGEAIDSFKGMQDETNKQLDSVEKEVDEFIETTSDRLANVLNPNRIQKEVADRTVKKLMKMKEDWEPFDYGLSEISSVTKTLLSGQVSPELLPSDGLYTTTYPSHQQQEIPNPQQQEIPNPQESLAVPVEVISSTQEKPLTEETTQKHQDSLISPIEQLRKARYKREKSANPS